MLRWIMFAEEDFFVVAVVRNGRVVPFDKINSEAKARRVLELLQKGGS